MPREVTEHRASLIHAGLRIVFAEHGLWAGLVQEAGYK